MNSPLRLIPAAPEEGASRQEAAGGRTDGEAEATLPVRARRAGDAQGGR